MSEWHAASVNRAKKKQKMEKGKTENEILNKPIIQMNGREFLKLMAYQKTLQTNDSERELIKGRTQLAKRLDVSVSSLIKWENEGLIRPETQAGRVIIFDLQSVLNDLRNYGKK